MPPTSFGELHAYLLDVSSPPERQIEYVFRHIPPKGYESSIETEAKTYLSGYGVSLDLKKMDYLALDDRRQGSNSREEFASETSDLPYDTDRILSLVHQYPENVTADYVAPLSEEELLQIGMQSTQLIYDAGEENALATLKQLSQNFPKYVKDVARRVTAEDKLEAEIMDNQVKAQGGISMAWLNGVVIQETDWNPFSLLRLLRKERSTMQSLMSLRLTSEQAIELLTHRAVGVAQADSGVLDGIFDASDRLEGEGAIVWWNDFENDSRYARWGPSLSLLLRPMYPGQLPNLKLNIFNVVVVADLSQSSALNFIAGAVSNIIQRNFPFRWGIVPIIETEEGERMARLFYWLVENLGQTKTMEFIARISQVQTPVHLITPTVDWSLVHSEFHHAISERLDNDEVSDHFPRHIDLELILSGSVGDSAEVLQKARTYAKRLSADLASAPQGHTFLNGKHFNLDDDFLRNMQVEAGQQLLHLQEQLYHGLLTPEDGARISTYFYDRPEASKRRSKHIYPSGKPEGLKILSLTDLILHSHGSFVYPPESEGHNLPLTTFVVTDLDSTAGAELVKEVLSAMEDSTTRVAFIHNPSTKGANTNPSPGLSGLLRNLGNKGLLHGITPSRLLDVLRSGSVGPSKAIDQVVLSAEGLSDDALREALLPDMTEETEDYQQFVEASRFVLRDLKIGPGEQVVIMNGRVVGPLGRGEFVAEDFQELVAYEYRKRVGPVVDALADILPALDELDRIDYADFVSSVSSVISSIHLPDPSESGLFNAPIKPRRRNYQLLAGEYTKFEYGDNSTAFFHVGILLDPLSEAAQKWSSLLEWLLDDPAVFVELHINPARYKEMPLKRFYRYSVSPKINFDENGEEIPSKLTFHGLPEEPIYTLAMDVAPSWLVRPREALYDLDNILLSALSNHERAKGIQAIFDLDYLVIEGHARQVFTNSPPRGLQMQLVANSTPIADTLVVANLGYLQFRTKPGVFRLEIRPGRGREIFHMESVGNEGWDSPSVAEVGNEVTLMSFEGLTLYPRVTRFPGMEGVDVLATESVPGEDEGLFGKIKESISSLFSSKSTEVAVAEPNDDQAEINIFTVASGLLYERFASIMILSVLRNTKSTVKFWFIENFLSPSFLVRILHGFVKSTILYWKQEFIPHFAKEYGFQYELVTYKWPSWLRAQKEKQRIIWAYKILFLDVLFPMDLKKSFSWMRIKLSGQT
ncbi:hypothetical protein EW026_g5286 [Hermanssonia centrifuga]|uniref:UDP-glucose:glycoprotein glucosyltransferase n=1 Tax=Hermanssonia centrifuga TaxID=98765 RepID=A0A4V3XA32_9APHY|nr:hypothetical protein EW026_g5286 [Hermanssonia centrifuga]